MIKVLLLVFKDHHAGGEQFIKCIQRKKGERCALLTNKITVQDIDKGCSHSLTKNYTDGFRESHSNKYHVIPVDRGSNYRKFNANLLVNSYPPGLPSVQVNTA